MESHKNRKVFYFFCCLIACWNLPFPLWAGAAIGNLGTDFWLGFPQSDGFNPSTQELFITCTTNTSGSVQVPGIGFSTSFSIAAGGTATVILPSA
ncbi:MAG TPA: hypothetical protein VK859_15080, partial [bacterium]|nr:hypothetical protein [bacterium]